MFATIWFTTWDWVNPPSCVSAVVLMEYQESLFRQLQKWRGQSVVRSVSVRLSHILPGVGRVSAINTARLTDIIFLNYIAAFSSWMHLLRPFRTTALWQCHNQYTRFSLPRATLIIKMASYAANFFVWSPSFRIGVFSRKMDLGSHEKPHPFRV